MTDTQADKKKFFKKTLNLPRTSFSMKANLVQNEPQTIKRWQKNGLYEQVREAGKGRPRFVFHDGPPYANGSIHLGHLLNKVLKDVVVRSKTMLGYDVPYVPGWDCHGLPIEHKVMEEELVKGGDEQDPVKRRMNIRKACRKYADKFIKQQAGEMQRLLTVADYDNPYLTMDPAYEGAVLDVFAAMVERGLVYRDLKPVHWSVANRTALAEAELEYYDRTDTSVFVRFELTADQPDDADSDTVEKLKGLGDEGLAFMIWTTTPWTLPANIAVAVAKDAEYGVYQLPDKSNVMLACDLAEKVLGLEGVEVTEPKLVLRGSELEHLTYQHPFVDHVGPVVLAEYVTLEDGTGLVHTAPGHGKEDYDTGKRYNLPIYCPVLEDGTFDDTVPDWLKSTEGNRIDIWKANGLVVEHLRESGHLFHDQQFDHSYPHDWRGKTPVIFRATEQWFVAVDKAVLQPGKKTLRELALAKTGTDVKFVPAWGRNRMRGMLETRPDWCLSRQRAWGLPIPAFFAPEGEGEPLLTPRSVAAVANVIRHKGSDIWFYGQVTDLLVDYNPVDDLDAPDWLRKAGKEAIATLRKSDDIFDVWFESGSSWNAAIRQRFGKDSVPTDLYLEGSDQHRGWFQLSLLPALGVTGEPPFKSVLTHGFMVDKNGRKMSKSEGNAIQVEDLMQKFGADVCRWWVCGLNYESDIKADMSFFEEAGESYRKVRNTLRYMLSNLEDFDHHKHSENFDREDATSIDAWAMNELAKVVRVVRQAYENYDYRRANEALFNFCNDTLSAVYLAAIKDRLYCDPTEAPRRRRTQTALYRIAHALIRLLAPMLPHTADEAWAALHKVKIDEVDSVLLELLPEDRPVECSNDWPKVMADREEWLRAIEGTRAKHEVDNPLDLGVKIAAGGEAAYVAGFDPGDLADLCGVSQVVFDTAVEKESAEPVDVLDLRDAPRCERSWKRDGTVEPHVVEGLGEVLLSKRDFDAVRVAMADEG